MIKPDIDFSKYILHDKSSVKEALISLNDLSDDTLTLFIINSDDDLIGSLTDGDIRRNLINGVKLEDNVKIVMNSNFSYIRMKELDVETFKKMKSLGIHLLPILDDENRIVSILNLKKKKSLLPIDAVLMAGGKGERLRPLTEKTPKPLLKVGDKAIIDYNIDSLIDYGVKNINVTINYLASQIEEHFSLKEGIKIKCIREPQYLGTMGSVKLIESFENNVILVMNSDLFTNINYEDFYLHFERSNADMSVATIPYSVTIPYGIFDLDGRQIKGIKEKPTYNYHANAGIYLLKKKLLDLLPKDSFFDATDLIYKLIENNNTIIRFPIIGYWIDIGKHEDYQKAQDLAKHF